MIKKLLLACTIPYVSFAMHSYKQVKKELQESSFDTNNLKDVRVGKKKLPLIHKAAKKGEVDFIEVLLGHKIDVNQKYKDRTALMYAADKGRLEAIKLLVEQGADLYQKDFFGRPALNYAIQTGQTPVVAYFLTQNPNFEKYFTDEGPVHDIRQYGGFTNNPLTCAAMKGNVTIVELLLNAGAPVTIDNEYDDFRHLQEAASKGFSLIVDLLLRHGAGIDERGKRSMWPHGKIEQGPTALMSAVFAGQITVVQLLLSKGANSKDAYETARKQKKINKNNAEKKEQFKQIMKLLKD